MTNTLSEHIRNPLDHGRLPFHADCPICRTERLVGPLPSQVILSARARAGLAAAVLAASAAGAPAVAIASPEPQQESEGQSGEDEEGGGSPDSLDFDPGGGEEGQDNDPEGGGQPDDADQDDVTDTLEPEPQQDSDALEAYNEELRRQGQVPAPETPQPVSSPPEVQTPASPVQVPTVDTGKATESGDAEGKSEPRKESGSTTKKEPSRATEAPKAQEAPAPAPEEAPVQTVAEPPPVADTGSGASNASEVPESSGDVHVVKPGETLWSIAAARLGADASAAEIAREVDRLWRLNAERIGTGNPDLIMSGQNLVL